MGIPQAHTIYATRLFSSDMGAEAILDAVTNQSVMIENTINAEPTSGAAWARFLPITSQRFRKTMATYSLKTWLDEVGPAGKSVSPDTGKPGVQLYAQLLDASNAGRASGSNHRSYTIARGLVVPRRLTCTHGGDATLEYEVFGIYDGTNTPIVVANSEALPSLAGDSDRFTIGPMTMGGVLFTGVRRFELNFGVNVVVDGSDGDIWPTHVSIESYLPEITLSGVDLTWYDNSGAIPLGGIYPTHANTSMYLRKRDESTSSFVADGTAEHIKMTAAGTATIESAGEGESGAKQEANVRLALKHDGTNFPVVFDTASTIT